jgi:YidC/Oxa1 family membrane protein insertase
LETRALLAFLISVAILFGYQVLFAPEPRPLAPVDAARDPQAPPRETPEVEAEPAPDPQVAPSPPADERTVQVETDLYRATFTSFGGRLKHFELKEQRVTADRNSPPLDMVVSESLLPLGVYWKTDDGRTAGDARISFDVQSDAPRAAAGQTVTVTMAGTAADGARVTKTVTLRGDSYVARAAVRVDSASAIGLAWARQVPKLGANAYGATEGPVAFVDDVLQVHQVQQLEAPVTHEGVVDWAGYEDHYFLAAYYPDERRLLRFVGAKGGEVGEVILWDDAAAGEISLNLFVGPKSIRLLGSLGHNLQEAINLGYFAFIARPMLELLILLHRFLGNYGWAIILLTLGIRIVFYPVNKKQLEAMKAMQRIQPELKRIQEKYKDDREQLNKEMIEVYRRHKVNPLGGCLPMLLQLPVFLGLYNALMQAIELRHAPFIGWINDLSQPDRLGALPIPLVSPPGIPVLTLLMGASMVVQQKMTPSSADPVQQRMMMILPVVFTVMFINFPAGLVLYWLSNNVLSIAQQQLMTRSKS